MVVAPAHGRDHRGQPSSSARSASTKASGSKGARSWAPSPRPTSLTGMPRSRWTATTMPPLAVPSSLVSTTPVTPTAPVNSRAWARPFWPVVASSTSSTSLMWPPSRSSTRRSLRSSSMRLALVCNRPAVSTSTTSAPRALAEARPSKATAAGSAPCWWRTTWTPTTSTIPGRSRSSSRSRASDRSALATASSSSARSRARSSSPAARSARALVRSRSTSSVVVATPTSAPISASSSSSQAASSSAPRSSRPDRPRVIAARERPSRSRNRSRGAITSSSTVATPASAGRSTSVSSRVGGGGCPGSSPTPGSRSSTTWPAWSASWRRRRPATSGTTAIRATIARAAATTRRMSRAPTTSPRRGGRVLVEGATAQPPAHHLADPVGLHRDAVEGVARLHRAPLVADDQELGLLAGVVEQVEEPVQVDVVEGRLDLVEDVERARPGTEDREVEGERDQAALAARQQRQASDPLARRAGLDLDPARQQVLRVGEQQAAVAAGEQQPEGPLELAGHVLERLAEHLADPLVDGPDDLEQVAAALLEVLELAGQEGVALLQRPELLEGERVQATVQRGGDTAQLRRRLAARVGFGELGSPGLVRQVLGERLVRVDGELLHDPLAQLLGPQAGLDPGGVGGAGDGVVLVEGRGRLAAARGGLGQPDPGGLQRPGQAVALGGDGGERAPQPVEGALPDAGRLPRARRP